jgi:hypothetical protein
MFPKNFGIVPFLQEGERGKICCPISGMEPASRYVIK